MNKVSHTLRFLGTGASCGVPSFYCGCKACEEALLNPAAQRGCSALLIRGRENTLIDAGPDVRMQLSRAKAKDVARVLLTHEHFDHVGGMAELEFYVRLRSKAPVPVYAGSHTHESLAQQFAYMADTLEPHHIQSGQQLEFDGVRYTALPATHGTETFGFLIERLQEGSPCAEGRGGQANEGGLEEEDCCDNEEKQARAQNEVTAQPVPAGKRIAYFPDTGPLLPEVHEVLKGIDVLIIDATFNGSNWMPAAHHSIDEAIQLAQDLGAQKTFLTHLSMHYDQPITAAELQMSLAPHNGTILAANDGLEITL